MITVDAPPASTVIADGPEVDAPAIPMVIIDKGKRYTRDSHPLLFRVVDWITEDYKPRIALSARAMAQAYETDRGESASKSWCNVAKNYLWSEAGQKYLKRAAV